MRSRTRRDLLRETGTLAGLGVVGSLSGCLGLFGDSESGDDSPAKDVPSRAGALLHGDFQRLFTAEGVLTSADEALAKRERPAGTPDSVEGMLEWLRETYSLDPRQLNRATAFVGRDVVESETLGRAMPEYWGVIGYTDWGDDAMRTSFRNAAPERVTESTHDGATVLEIGAESLSVLGDGVVVLGSKPAVEDTIDVFDGSGATVTDSLRRAFDASAGEFARFAADVDAAALATRTLGAQVTEVIPAESIGRVHGSVFDDGEGRGVRVIVGLGSATDAEQLAAQIDSFVGLVRAQGFDSPPLDRYERLLGGVETTTDGKQLTATYRAPPEMFDDVAGQALADSLLRIVQP